MPIRTTDLARALECDPTMISRWARRGMPTDSIEAARAWRAATITSRVRVGALPPGAPDSRPASGFTAAAAAVAGGVAAPDQENGPGDYNKARTRREIAEAAMAELRLGEQRGELIRLAAVKNALAVMFATARDALLQIPSRMAPLLAGETDPATVQRLLYADIHQTLVELSGAGERLGKADAADELAPSAMASDTHTPKETP